MGTRDEFERLLRLCVDRGMHPPIDRSLQLAGARAGFTALADGDVSGKIVSSGPNVDDDCL